MSLTFDKAAHRYAWDGTPVPSVTQVLALINDYSKVDPDALEKARQEGEDMHLMAELHFKGNLDEGSLPAWLEPRLRALKRFIEETGFTPAAIESRMYHRAYRYAGTADLIGEFPRYRVGRIERPVMACVDIKRSFYAARSLGLQTAGYGAMWSSDNPSRPVTHRFGLRLLATGKYDLFPCNRQDDFGNFIACLNVHFLKESINA